MAAGRRAGGGVDGGASRHPYRRRRSWRWGRGDVGVAVGRHHRRGAVLAGHPDVHRAGGVRRNGHREDVRSRGGEGRGHPADAHRGDAGEVRAGDLDDVATGSRA
ncbi:hypothetical protein SDC9_209524 [bioreactor metagenome]|uniref:Uncharacterized protein n=1 Tax=bioreactor metagenome TaxID=1076179 RepID=A0A645JDW7_9ZZZZ